MSDIFTPEKRSEVMSRIRSTDTVPERRLFELVAELLQDCKIDVRRNVRDLPGQPDLVIDDLGVVIFLDGCFYHSCPHHGHVPKSNREYWEPKLLRTTRRDVRNRRRLRSDGWSVWRLWEHDLRRSMEPATARRLERRLRKLLETRQEA